MIGQGTWYIDDGDRAAAIAALRRGLDLGMTHIDTAEMYGRARRGPGRRGDRRAARRGLPRLQGAPAERLARAGRSRPASGRSRAWGPTGSTATSCTGAASIRWRTRSRPSSSSGARARSSPGASATSTWPTSTRPWRSRARAASPATRCSTTWSERAIEHAVIPWCEAHGVAVVAYSPFGHGALPGPAHEGRPRAAGDRRPRTARRRARSRCGSWCAGRRCSRSPRRRARSTPPRTRGPATFG